MIVNGVWEFQDECKPAIEVEELFPHNKHCMLPKCERIRTALQRDHAGSGSVILDFDFDTIIGTTYDDMIAKLDSYQDPAHRMPPREFIVNGVD